LKSFRKTIYNTSSKFIIGRRLPTSVIYFIGDIKCAKKKEKIMVLGGSNAAKKIKKGGSLDYYLSIDRGFNIYTAVSPFSPVRILTTSSTGDMKIFPSPIFPV